ncbi:MAG: hypothetical protein ACYDG2_16970 [Ruminiclostridium sp.]
MKKLQNKNESIRCSDCNYFTGSQCSKNSCICIAERLTAGMICYETIVENCYKEFKAYRFKKRLARLVRNFDGEVFINPIHRFRFMTENSNLWFCLSKSDTYVAGEISEELKDYLAFSQYVKSVVYGDSSYNKEADLTKYEQIASSIPMMPIMILRRK